MCARLSDEDDVEMSDDVEESVDDDGESAKEDGASVHTLTTPPSCPRYTTPGVVISIVPHWTPPTPTHASAFNTNGSVGPPLRSYTLTTPALDTEFPCPCPCPCPSAGVDPVARSFNFPRPDFLPAPSPCPLPAEGDATQSQPPHTPAQVGVPRSASRTRRADWRIMGAPFVPRVQVQRRALPASSIVTISASPPAPEDERPRTMRTTAPLCIAVRTSTTRPFHASISRRWPSFVPNQTYRPLSSSCATLGRNASAVILSLSFSARSLQSSAWIWAALAGISCAYSLAHSSAAGRRAAPSRSQIATPGPTPTIASRPDTATRPPPDCVGTRTPAPRW